MDELNALEFDKIRNRLAKHAACEGAAELCLNLMPATSFRAARRALEETAEAVEILQTQQIPSVSDLRDVVSPLRRAASGAVLNVSELLAIAVLMRVSQEYTASRPGFIRVLADDYDALTVYPTLQRKISDVLVLPDEVTDAASPELRSIRRKQGSAKEKIRTILDSLIRSSSVYLQDSIITIRNNRYVLPVRAECRNDVPGLVHDTSSSGSTLFIEPMGVVNANNDISALVAEENREIDRILTDFSQQVGAIAEPLLDAYRALVHLDFVFAKARYAVQQDAVCPTLTETGKTVLKSIRHPLLDRATAVPVDLEIGGEFNALIVTGPNTGGKTVSLKTLGLACIMAKSGLFLCADFDCTVRFFDSVFADIGDEQSIENSLSTFSAHIAHIVRILENVSENSLVLFDELGSGTDPAEGAALAISVIEFLRARGVCIMATTHYAELKLYALQTEGIENASCEFDVSTLRPTYRLILGIPGKSNAFAIARRLGMNEEILEGASGYLSSETVKMEKLLADLEITRLSVEQDKKDALRLRNEAATLQQNAERIRKETDDRAKAVLEDAKRRALELVQQSRRDADRLLDGINELRKEKEAEALGQKYIDKKHETERLLSEREAALSPKKEKRVLNRLPVEGDAVRSVTYNKAGTVLSVDAAKKKVVAQIGIMKVTLPFDDLEFCGEKTTLPKSEQGKISYDTGRFDSTLKNELDLRGMNVMEAEDLIESYLDSAAMAGYPSVSLIHGKGTGTLRKGVHALLKRNPHVDSFRLGTLGEGDTGVTVVTLKPL